MLGVRQADPLTLVGLIYEAALSPARWPEALEAVADALGAVTAWMGAYDRRDPSKASFLGARLDPAWQSAYRAHFHRLDVWLDRGLRVPVSSVKMGDELVAPWDFERSELFNDFLRPQDIRHMIGSFVGRNSDVMVSTAFHTSARAGAFDEDARSLLQRLAPHLDRASRVTMALDGFNGRRVGCEAVLNLLPYGVMLLDSKGRLQSANQEAERILGCGDGLGLRAGAIQVRHQGTHARLRAAISEICSAAPSGGTNGGTLLTVPREGAKRPYQVLLAPVPGRAHERAFGFSVRIAAVMIVSDPEVPSEPTAVTLGRVFGLTPALARLAAALVAGRTLAEYADAARISQGTARGYLKELFARTSTGRQSELVRLLLSGIAQVRVPGRPEA
jgi:DNA-binding CsgD family transcriptional regulator/PAS domain-containing protein